MSSNGFILDVVYENTEESGALTNYIPEGNLEGIPLELEIVNEAIKTKTTIKINEKVNFLFVLYLLNLNSIYL